MRLWLAIRAFFRVLFDAEAAQKIRQVMEGTELPSTTKAPSAPVPAPQAAPKAAPESRRPARNDALTLLATLQREARFVDFLQEEIAAYSDAQIGAAVRDIHRDCGKVLDRVFKLHPILKEEEGAEVSVPAEPDRYRLLGNVSGSPPFRGRLVHHGWEAAICELPAWTGSESGARVVAPAEVELK